MNILFLAKVYNMSNFKAYMHNFMLKHKFYFELEY